MNALVRELFQIGTTDPYRLVDILNKTDPFGVKLAHPDDFVCDTNLTMRFPQYLDVDKLKDFRDNEPGTYIFYQHIRKAGGTEFCDLAKRNIPKAQKPLIACQYYWWGAMATMARDYDHFIDYMTTHNYKVAFNEWDVFYEYFFKWKGAIFVTEFRDPLERWYSQYRFEHLEYHAFPPAPKEKIGTPREPFMYWYGTWTKKTMGVNYYVKTFIGPSIDESYYPVNNLHHRNQTNWYWTYTYYQDKPITIEMFERAISNLSKFSLIFILEWISEPGSISMLEKHLGWKEKPTKVIPNEEDFQIDKEFMYHLIDAVRPDEYRYMAAENVLDILFYHISRRMYLERLKCPSH